MDKMFLNLFEKNPAYQRILSEYENRIINITGLTDNAKPHFLYGLFKKTNKNIVVIGKSDSYNKKLNEMLNFFDISSGIFYDRELNFYNIDAKSSEVFLSRINTLSRISDGEKGIYLTTLDALTKPVMPQKILEAFSLSLSINNDYELLNLIKILTLMGYKKVDMVEFKGQFSRRGDVLDVFDTNSSLPYRIEFFGDTVDSIRTFDEKTQLSIDRLERIVIRPGEEIVYNEEMRDKTVSYLSSILKRKISAKLKEEIKWDIDRIKNNEYFPGLDKYVGLFYKDSNFLDYFDENTIYIIDEPQRLSEKKEALISDYREQIINCSESGLIYPEIPVFLDVEKTVDTLVHRNIIGIMSIITSNPVYHANETVSVVSSDCGCYYGRINLLRDDLRNYKNEKYTVILPIGEKKINNFRMYLENESIHCDILNEDDEFPEYPGIYLLKKTGVMGFCYSNQRFILLYDNTVFGDSRKTKKKQKKNNDVLSFSDLQPGDFVVHSVHGIGKYIGTQKLEMDGVRRDFLKIKYKGTDILYVPINQLDNLNKYVGAGESHIKLNRLGGQEFSRVKDRVRASCSELADKLIALYAEREKTKGHKFMEDTDMQVLFEQTFPYTETEDQLRSIEEVKTDMESEKPMDRLLCGDVGYGKTEVAMRAAFKCAVEGKQTAYLASTTLLCEQHYNSFKSRMEGFAVNVEMLSRFRTKKQQTEILKKLKAGEIDILIGTHRLLSKDVEFKDLGLLIVDEEQRFGVAHKEKLKELKKNVEVLTLTATPIPRTLHMSMLGIRDMSVLKEPPQDRFPVQTYVLEYDEGTIRNAIQKELSRGGQVFYLYNDIETINKTAERIRLLCPEANVAVAHGRMSENSIEKIFINMMNGEVDILICTTIIETGIDISNANTIIVENSDRLGLSQLYQLRGRVGRGGRLAYCYLTYKKDKVLTEISENRLKTIKEFTEFGSGFKIALRDMEIRGAGNILGAQQHGHMDAVGYDMYMKILSEAIKNKKGEKVIIKEECRIDIKENAYIPESYIDNHDLRMDMYKKIASIKTFQDVSDITDEIIDRFSNPPLYVLNLIDVSYIKALAEGIGIVEITDVGSRINFKYKNPENMDFEKISEVAEEFKGKILINTSSECGFFYKIINSDRNNKLSNIKKILQILS